MSFTKGNFTCPNCGSNQMNGYEHWIFKRISSNKTRWIFFKINIQKHGRKWTFFCKCFEDGFKCRCCKNQEGKIIGDAIAKSDSDGISVFVAGLLILGFYIFIAEIYFFSFFWVDLIRYIFSNKTELDYEYTCLDNGQIIKMKKEGVKEDTNIFEFYGGIPENLILQLGSHLFYCKSCNHRESNFKSFIDEQEIYNSTENEINSTTDAAINNNNNVLSSGNDGDIYDIILSYNGTNYPFHFDKNTNFRIVINKFYEQNPESRNENCVFMANGRPLDKNKSLAQNGINNGHTILVMSC